MIESDVQKLAPGAIVDLFELDATALGGSVIRWHNGINALGNDVVWQGNSYTRFPVEASGFARSGQGSMPRPTMKVANVSGLVGALARELRDLCGAKVTRRRTFVKYLDAVNFPGGVNPQADPNVGFPNEIWFVDRKAAENGIYVEFELSAAFDVQGVKLPRRQCIQNVCQSQYRRWDAVAGAFDYTKASECGYVGVAMYTKDDLPTTDPAQDQCGKRLGSCKKRFGEFETLNTSAFPGVGLVR